MSQEPGSNSEIKAWTEKNYGITFPLFEKCEVNGDNTCEIYRFLRVNSSLSKDGKVGSIPWNFAKFIIKDGGKSAEFFDP